MKILGLGVPELLIILAVALLIFGPKHLPKLGRSLGRTIHNFREGLGNDKDVVKEAEEEEIPIALRVCGPATPSAVRLFFF